MIQAKDAIRRKLGPEMYEEIYRFLVYHRSHEQTDEQMMFEELKYRVAEDKNMLNEVFKLDGIVFREIVLQN